MRKFWRRMASFARICAVGMLLLGVGAAALLVWQPQALMHGVYAVMIIAVVVMCVQLAMGAVQMMRK